MDGQTDDMEGERNVKMIIDNIFRKEETSVPKVEVIVVDVIQPETCKEPFVVDLRSPPLRDSAGEVVLWIEEPNRDRALTPADDVKEAVKEEKEIEIQEANTETGGVMFEDREKSQADMFICDLCYRIFGNQYKLDSHISRAHKMEKRPKTKDRMKRPQRKEDDWPPDVQRLAKRVDGVKTFFCNLCSYKVTRCDSMSKHMLRVHSEGRAVAQYQCEVCGKTFADKAYLRNHGVSHVTEKHHTCEVCGRAFHRQPSLKRHHQIHLESKQFACLLCDYKSNRKHLMYKHAELHRAGRAYRCKFCGQGFYTQISLRSHLYTHNVSPNSCSFCRVGFSSRERMISHMKRVHFACEIRDIKDEPR